MIVKDAIDMLAFGTAYEIKGAYSGKIYHRSYYNSSKNLDKYAGREITDSPFHLTLAVRGGEYNNWAIPVIGIWMHDYDIVKGDKGGREDDICSDEHMPDNGAEN